MSKPPYKVGDKIIIVEPYVEVFRDTIPMECNKNSIFILTYSHS